MNLWAIFTTGLFVGGLTCMAVQGGLLATTIANREEEKLKKKTKSTGNALPILSFLIAKLVAYTVLGFLLGWFGSLFQLSLTTQIILQFGVGIFMIGTALNLVNVHPIFRYFVIQPPRFLTRLVRKKSKSNDVFAPAILGAFTVFIPCGTTQAMMALAIASGNPLLGASILFAFTLGTSPVFFTLGYLATKLGDAMQQKFIKVAAYAIILLAIFNLNNTLALSGSDFTLDRIWKSAYCTLYFCDDSPVFANAQISESGTVSNATVSIEGAGYSPNNFSVKAGSKVKLNLVNNGGGGCTQAFTIPRLGIQKVVPLGASDTITFTAPSEPGQLAFMCGMGMFRGIINVI
jgi:sulfite exporter TauE/SafE